MVDCGFELWFGETEDYEDGICCFVARHAALRSKRKDWWLGIRIMCLSRAPCIPTDCVPVR